MFTMESSPTTDPGDSTSPPRQPQSPWDAKAGSGVTPEAAEGILEAAAALG